MDVDNMEVLELEAVEGLRRSEIQQVIGWDVGDELINGWVQSGFIDGRDDCFKKVRVS